VVVSLLAEVCHGEKTKERRREEEKRRRAVKDLC